MGHAEGALFASLETSGYRSKEEYQEWQKRDPVKLYHDRLLQDGILNATEADAIDREESERVLQAEKFAMESPWPKPEEAYSHVYSNPIKVD
jgi:pyruvate dehydrogenase E1 component alpha subunit